MTLKDLHGCFENGGDCSKQGSNQQQTGQGVSPHAPPVEAISTNTRPRHGTWLQRRGRNVELQSILKWQLPQPEQQLQQMQHDRECNHISWAWPNAVHSELPVSARKFLLTCVNGSSLESIKRRCQGGSSRCWQARQQVHQRSAQSQQTEAAITTPFPPELDLSLSESCCRGLISGAGRK
jgi:hypothetical protein